jgi:cob(I)alamin adenosyltransferase
MLNKGYIQVYTGNGKGKTTAALGLTLRTICAGNKVFFGQFMKGQSYSELKAMEFLPNLKMEQFGDVNFVNGAPSAKDIENGKKGLERIKEVLLSDEYDVVVCDELNMAMFFKILDVKDVLEVLKLKPEKTELILTGRYAPEEIVDYADLVTEMKEIKHYFNAGVDSRIGIED